jgi:hypothetical protein
MYNKIAAYREISSYGLVGDNMGKKDKDFCFAVGDTSPLSGVWRVCIRKNDVYMLPPHPSNEHKISFHASGICHSALTAEAAKKFRMDNKQRRSNEWTIKPAKNEAKTMFCVFFPHEHLRTDGTSSNSAANSNIIYLPVPKQGCLTIVEIAKVGKPPIPFNVSAPSNTKVFHVVYLLDGDVLLFLVHQERMSVELKKSIGLAVNAAKSMQPTTNLTITGGFACLESKASHVRCYVDFYI